LPREAAFLAGRASLRVLVEQAQNPMMQIAKTTTGDHRQAVEVPLDHRRAGQALE